MYFNAKQLHQFLNETDIGRSNKAYVVSAFIDGTNRYSLTSQRIQEINNSPVSLETCTIIMRRANAALARRDQDEMSNLGLFKWIRPWDVIPKLRNIVAPPGDFTVGVEIEMGFASQAASSLVAKKVLRMRNVTADWEGGTYPIEATFPPALYSKFGPKSPSVKYVEFLAANLSILRHSGHYVGTHVNVGSPELNANPNRVGRLAAVNGYLQSLSSEDKAKYFGRAAPYRYGIMQQSSGGNAFVEWKLFNSSHEVPRFCSYVHTGVELVRLIASDIPITEASVRRALDTGYHKAYPRTA